MNDREEHRRRLREKAKEVAKTTDLLLEPELTRLREVTLSDLERLRPRVSDTAAYDELLAAVTESTRQNENLTLLKSRLETLGKRVLAVGSEAVRLLA